MKSLSIFLAVSLLTASTGAAETQKMIVKTTDGTQKTFNVSDVEYGSFTAEDGSEVFSVNGTEIAPIASIASVSFMDMESMPFTIVNADGEYLGAYPAVPSVLRVPAATSGQSAEFAFGTVAASEAAQLAEGEYGIRLSLTASAMQAGGVTDLGANPDSYKLTLYTYDNGQAVDSVSTVTAGDITYSWTATRRRLVLNINATFSNGLSLKSAFTGTPTDVESIAAMVPEKVYANEMVVVDASGTSSTAYAITELKETSNKPTTSQPYDVKFRFVSDDFYEGDIVVLVNADEVINKGEIDLANTELNCYCIKIGYSVQYWAPAAQRQNPMDGVMEVKKADDGSYDIFVQFTDKYKAIWGGESGSGKNYTIHWHGPASN